MIDDQRDKAKPDTPALDAARQAELQAAYHAESATPYKDARIRTIHELHWLMRERNWSGESFLAEGMSRANLSGADLDWANLSGAHLVGANLSGAYLSKANLSGTDLVEANLSGAILDKGNLNGADLGNANLDGANLHMADMHGANLREANLNGADLREVEMDAQTNLDRVTLDRHTKLGDIRWNGAPLLRVSWEHLLYKSQLHLGDEDAISQTKQHQKRRAVILDAARAYRGLGRELKDQNLAMPASWCRLRERRLERRAMLLERRTSSFFNGLGSWMLDLVAGYGELPARTFMAYVLVVGLFAALDFLVTNTVDVGKSVAHLSWDQSLVLSLTSFHGRGFFPGYIQLDDWVARIGAVEAVIGLFIELILIATFSRRFLGD